MYSEGQRENEKRLVRIALRCLWRNRKLTFRL